MNLRYLWLPSDKYPSVKKTSTPAIFLVVLEVSILTAFRGLGMHALGGLQIDNGDVNAPGASGRARPHASLHSGDLYQWPVGAVEFPDFCLSKFTCWFMPEVDSRRFVGEDGLSLV